VSGPRPDVPDLLGMTLGHRMMRADLHRLTAVVEAIAAGRTDCPNRRTAALVRWCRDLCDEIHHHHAAEDEIGWPVIAQYAGDSVDLAVLSDDHSALDPMLDTVRVAATTFAQAPEDRRRDSAVELAAGLARVRDELDEHIEAEEAAIFPVVEKYVPAAEWARTEQAARKSGPGARYELTFSLPRIVSVATPEEYARLRRTAGPVLTPILALVRPSFRRRERLVFGS